VIGLTWQRPATLGHAPAERYQEAIVSDRNLSRGKSRTAAVTGMLRPRVKPHGRGSLPQLSRNDLSFLLLLGCFNFLSAFASICRMRSLVTENC
jgi:hypothetical protein